MRRAVVLVAAGALVVGCSAPVAGPPPPAPAASPAPARPRELRLDGVDPCSLLTPAQRTALGLELHSRATTSGPPTAGPACNISGFSPRVIVVSIAAAASTDLSKITHPAAVTDALTPITVAGYPAVVARSIHEDVCFVDIGVAAGQIIDVQFGDGGNTPPIRQDELCQGAVQVADYVEATLSAQR